MFEELIYKKISDAQQKFESNCEIIIFDFSNNDIVNILNNEFLDKEFEDIIKIFENLNIFKHIYFFKDKIKKEETSGLCPGKSVDWLISKFYPELEKYFYESDGKYFLYIIVEYKKERVYFQACKNLILSLKKLFKLYNIHNRIFSSLYCRNCEKVSFHLICKGIYFSYKLDDIKIPRYDKPQKEILREVPSKLKIKDFFEYVNQSVNDIYNDLQEVANFQLQTDNKFKKLREEYLAIVSYLIYLKIDENNEIFLGKEKEMWDAKVLSTDNEIIIEVTQASADNEHITRVVLSQRLYGYKGFSLYLRTIHQKGMNQFPNKIIEAINKKHDKNYNDNRVLIVSVLLEFAYEEIDIIMYWVKVLRQETFKGTFKEIWLALDAEQLIQLH